MSRLAKHANMALLPKIFLKTAFVGFHIYSLTLILYEIRSIFELSFSAQNSYVDSVKVLKSYASILKILSPDTSSKLRLFFDNDLGQRLNHLMHISNDALTLHNLGKCVFLESRALAETFALTVDCDLFNLTDGVAYDYTSSRANIPAKESILETNFEKKFKTEVKLISYKEINFKKILQNISEVTFPESFSWALKHTFNGEVTLDQSVAMRKDLISDVRREAERKMDGFVVQKVDDPNLAAYKLFSASNIASVKIAQAQRMSGTAEEMILMGYVETMKKTGVRDLMRVPVASTEGPEIEDATCLDDVSNLIKILRQGKIKDRWMAINKDFELEMCPFQVPKRKDGEKHMFIPSGYPYKAVVRKVAERLFEIRYNLSLFKLDGHFTAMLLSGVDEDFRKNRKVSKRVFNVDVDDVKTLGDIFPAAEKVSAHYMKPVEEMPPIFKHIKEVEFEKTPCKKVETAVKVIWTALEPAYKTKLSSSVAHEYYIAKTTSASFKAQAGYDTYFLGENGKLKSYSLIQRNAGVHNFTNAFVHTTQFDKSLNAYTSAKSTSFNPNTLEWALTKPFAIHAALTWSIENKISGNVKSLNSTKELSFLMEILCTNRDPFAQASELVRYLYLSALSYESDRKKLLDKLLPLYPQSFTELLYISRMLLTSHAIDYLKRAGDFEELKKGVFFAMPQDLGATNSMDYFVSSMYVSRFYNRQNFFRETTQARLTEDVLHEIEIYETAMVREELKGMKQPANDYLGEFENARKRILLYEERYNGSCFSTLINTIPFKVSSSIKFDLLESSTSALFTTSAAHRGDTVKREAQVTKAYVNAVEAYIGIAGASPEEGSTMSTYYANFIFIAENLEKIKDMFICYMFDKVGQIGAREIYAMNFIMRLSTYLVEEVGRFVSKSDSVNLQSSRNRDKPIENVLRSASAVPEPSFNEADLRKVTIYENSDATRWGPNQRMDVLAGLASGLLHEDDYDIAFLMFMSFFGMANKRIKIAPPLIDYSEKNPMGKGGGNAANFVRKHTDLILSNEPAFREPMGMGQGIYQEFSSCLHSVKQKFEMDCLKEAFYKELSFVSAFVSSDDSFKVLVLKLPKNIPLNMSTVWRKLAIINSLTGCYFSILRNKGKSMWQVRIAEFNSTFYDRGKAGRPDAKFKTSKIELGMGSNPAADLAFCLDSASDYLTAGGSYIGAYQMICANITMLKEHWGRATLRGSEYSLLGDVTSVEPLSAFLLGGYMYLALNDIRKSVQETVSDKQIARFLIKHWALDMKASVTRDSDTDLSNIWAGVVNINRRSKEQTLYKVHKEIFSSTKLVPSLRRKPKASFELMNRLEANLKVKSAAREEVDMFARFAEPWVSEDKEILRPIEGNILGIIGRTLTRNEYVRFVEDSFEVSLAAAVRAKSDLTDAEEQYVSIVESWIKVQKSCMKTMLSQNVQNADVLRVEHTPTKNLRLMTSAAKIQGQPAAVSILAYEVLGTEALEAIHKCNINLEYVKQNAKEDLSSSRLSMEDFFMRLASYDSKIKSVEPKRKMFSVAESNDSAHPAVVAKTMLRERFICGAGLEIKVEDSFDVQWIKDIYLVSAERKMLEEVSRQSTIRFIKKMKMPISEESKEFKFDDGLMTDYASAYGLIKDARTASKEKLIAEIYHSFITRSPMNLSKEELRSLMNGQLSLPAATQYSREEIRFYKSTTIASSEITLLGHVVAKVKNKYKHTFFIEGETSNPNEGQIIGIANSMKSLMDKPIFRPPNNLTDEFKVANISSGLQLMVEMADNSSMLLAVSGNIKIPLFPVPLDPSVLVVPLDAVTDMVQNFKGIKNTISDDDVELSSLEVTTRKEFARSYNEHFKTKLNTVSARSAALNIIMSVASVKLDKGEKMDIIANPISYAPKRSVMDQIYSKEEPEITTEIDWDSFLDMDAFSKALEIGNVEDFDYNPGEPSVPYDMSVIAEAFKVGETELNLKTRSKAFIADYKFESYMRYGVAKNFVKTLRELLMKPLELYYEDELELTSLRKRFTVLTLAHYMTRIAEFFCEKGKEDDALLYVTLVLLTNW